MQISGITLAEFSEAVRKANDAYDGNLAVADGAHDQGRRGCVARVRTHDSHENGSRTTSSGRHMPAACWHAYRDVLREVFEINPKAVIRTALATYSGAHNFEMVYPDTAYKNIGSQMSPAYMPDLCVGACNGDMS